MFSRTLCVISAFVTLGVFFVTDANAQWGGGMGGRRGGMGQGRGSSEIRQDAEKPIQTSNSSDQIQLRFDNLHSELQLTPTQETAWTQFADKFTRYIDVLVKEKITQTPFDPNISGVVHVSHLVDASRNKYTVLEELEETSKQLYSTLTRTQKLQFDTKIQNILVRDVGR